jgi:hypothetical protein
LACSGGVTERLFNHFQFEFPVLSRKWRNSASGDENSCFES